MADPIHKRTTAVALPTENKKYAILINKTDESRKIVEVIGSGAGYTLVQLNKQQFGVPSTDSTYHILATDSK